MASTRASPPSRTPISTGSPDRSTRWPTPCRPGSNGRPRFASDVSHELRSPITALTAAVEVLDARRDDIPERTQQALDVVVSQVRRFDDMVMDLLELSRLDAGAPDLNVEELDLVDLTRRIAGRYNAAEVPIDVTPRGTDRRSRSTRSATNVFSAT